MLPLTEEQREIWLGARHSEDASKAFNDVVVIRLHGQLDHSRLHGCLQALVNHHDALRTTFSPDGNLQRVAPSRILHLPVIDLTNLAVHDRETRLREIAVAEDTMPFDLERGPLFRTRLVVLSETAHVLLFAYHHIVVDGWSSAVLLRELDQLYGTSTGNTPRRLEPAMQFRDLVSWQEEAAQVEARADAEKFWSALYAEPPSPADLPTDRPRPAAKTFGSGKSTVTLDPAQCRRIKEACGPLNCTFFHYLFAVYTAWLYRLTGSADQVVGVPVAGQIAESLRERAGSRWLVGHCVHFLPVRIGCRGDRPFTEHLREVCDRLLEARDNECFTYGSLVKKLRLPRDPGRMPLVNVMFNLLPFAEDMFALENLKVRATFHPKAYHNFDLNVSVTVAGDALDISCEYSTALFDRATIVRWQGQWGAMIESLLIAPQCTLDRLTIMTPEEERMVISDWNRTARDFPADRCLHQIFEGQVRKSPQNVAVVGDDATLTYRELDEQAGALADHLRQIGVGPDVLVGICLERSTRMVVAVLGVLKAGGAYLPIDPTYPAERIAFMIEDAAPKAIVTQRSLVPILPASTSPVVLVEELRRGGPTSPAGRPVLPGNLAYVRYTSGSTGKPKGVQIEHRAIVNFIESMRRAPGIVASDVLLAVTTLSFDISELEVHLPLTTGACVVIAPWETAINGEALLGTIEKHGVTVMQATPATWRLMLEAGWAGTPGLRALCGGEGLPPDLARLLIPRCAELWNMYGPTETTVWSTCCRLTDPASASIGRPIANTDIYIRDSREQFVPIGVAGELLIGGDGVARGYLNRPELTSEKFIPHPFKPGQRVYRTGDLARYSSSGQIDCLGRLDSQVKIRGFRIELGEIEATIAGHPDVAQVVVAAREDIPGDKRLVAYYTTRDGAARDATVLRDFIRGTLAPYMLPTAFVLLERLPLNPAGKVDRKQLPAPKEEHSGGEGQSEPPATAVEEKLAAIWANVLKLASVGRHDNFFELGGNSLLAVAIFTQVEKDFGRNLPLAILFNSPTISGLARNLGIVEPGTANWPSLIPIRTEGTKPRFFCVHGAGGNILLYRELVARLGPDYPFYGFQSRGLDGKLAPLATVAEMAVSYVEELQRFQPHGPYCLGGYCLGGTIALEMADLLKRQGEEVSLVALLDTYNFAEAVPVARLHYFAQRLKFHAANFTRLRPTEMFSYLKEKVRVARDGEFAALFSSKEDPAGESDTPETRGRAALQSLQEINDRAAIKHRPKPYPGKLTLFKPKLNYAAFPDPEMGWGNIALDGLEIVELPLNPHAMLVEPFVRVLATALAAQLDRAALAAQPEAVPAETVA